ncbi:MAG: acetate--CoA ligase family protein, partial [Candidatus Marinimicrobia bacterium]|nr:acetate--CoA ligase family protein [Candidatus Neomarinimicrobiota bacterium]
SVKTYEPEARIDGILLEQMAKSGEEIILGVKNDPSFGPVLMFGLGGIFVEIFRDITFKVAPLSDTDIENMLKNIKGYPLLTGARSESPKDIAALKIIIKKLSNLALAHPEIAELDINPVIVHDAGNGCSIADIRIVLKK